MTDTDPLPSRRAVLVAAGAAAMAGATGAATAPGELLLKNVRLETGYDFDADGVSGTRTALFDVRIADGKIATVSPAGAATPPGVVAHDAGGLLMLPAFRDMHIHLDKTFIGEPWHAPRLKKNGIPGQIAIEQKLLPGNLDGLGERALMLVALMQSRGTTFARSQCNVDPVIGVQNVVRLKAALERRNATFGHEIVAFPQHGLIRVGLEPTLRAAMQAGATHVGGIDPTELDGAMERSVDTVAQIALDHHAGVDMHLHEAGESGVAAIERMIGHVEREPALKGRVTFSHCFCLENLSDARAEELAERMAAAGMSVASTVPMGRRIMPIPTLLAKGVPVWMGTDTTVDHWGVFGQCDVLLKAWIACQIYGWSDEFGLSQALRLATGGPVPLGRKGERLWPKAGDAADVVLVKAACSAETVARMPPRETVLHAGRLAAGVMPRRV